MVTAKTPRVSVVIPFKNSANFIRESVASVLTQTWSDLEVICVDDGSSDDGAGIVRDLALGDPRVRVVVNDHAPGLAGALNCGIAQATGEFIARLDSDDLATQNRLANQVRFLEANPEIALCGSWVKTFGDVEGTIWRLPVSHEDICVWMLFCSSIAHPAVMFRRKAFEDRHLRYDESFHTAEDFDLWSRASETLRFANVPQVLLLYRTHQASFSSGPRRESLLSYTHRVQLRHLDRLGVTYSPDELDVHWRISENRLEDSPDFRLRIFNWFEKLKQANQTSKIYDDGRLARYLADRLEQLPRIGPEPEIATVVPALESEPAPPKAPPVWRRIVRAFLPPIVVRALVRTRGTALMLWRERAALACDRNRIASIVIAWTPPVFLPVIKLLYRAIRPVVRRLRRWRRGILGDAVATSHTIVVKAPGLKIGMAVLVHERADYLRVCLDTLFQTRLSGYDVTFLLIDDGSVDPRVRDIVNEQRDPAYRIVRKFMPKGPNNAGAAINRAVKALHEMDDFDVVGWSDPDALYHPDWLDQMMKICLWAKKHHPEQNLGPFCCFNSSDQEFHRVRGTNPTPYGNYVVKRQMGMLNYFFVREDVERIGLFDENPDDETMMTLRLESANLRNFCTETSYVEHIGQESVLNQWRPTPVRRAVYGLNLVPTGWPAEIEHAETVGYFRDIEKPVTVGDDVWSDVPLDILYVATDTDMAVLPTSIEGIRRNLRHPIKDILIVAPEKSELRDLAPRLGCRFVNENDVVPIRKRDISYICSGVDRSGWLFQQLVKLGADSITQTDRYLVVDADTVLVQPQMFVADGKDLLLNTEWYHHPYIEAYMRLVNLAPKTLVTFVAHHMMFNRARLQPLKARMEQIGQTEWYNSIVNASDLSDASGFSEYETYGQWCLEKYPDKTIREFAFNFPVSRDLISPVETLMKLYGDKARSVSLHWHYNAPQ